MSLTVTGFVVGSVWGILIVLAKPEAMARAVSWPVKEFTMVSISSDEIGSSCGAV